MSSALTATNQPLTRDTLRSLSETYIREVLRRHIGNAPVYLFGSRARGSAAWNADYDLWVDADIPASTIVTIQEFLEESFVPLKVDMVSTPQLRGRFGEQVRAEAQRWM